MLNQSAPRFSRLGRVNKKRPCPICGKDDWCTVSDDGNFLICARKSSGGGNGWEYIKPTHNGGFLYKSYQTRSVTPIYYQSEKSFRTNPTTLDKVYKAFLKASPLYEHHLELLRTSRRLTDRDIASMEIKSRPNQADEMAILNQLVNQFDIETLLETPGFYIKNGKLRLSGGYGAILIPNIDQLKGYRITGITLRADKPHPDMPRYYTLSSVKHNGPPALLKASIYQGKNNRTIGITEGQFKAYRAAQELGYTMISTPGIGNWQSAGVITRSLEIAQVGGTVVIYYDMDGKPLTAKHAQELANALIHVGLRVYLAKWDNLYKGIDDFIVANTGNPVSLQPCYLRY
jgi:hypothetical protein